MSITPDVVLTHSYCLFIFSSQTTFGSLVISDQSITCLSTTLIYRDDSFKCANDDYIESHYYSVKKSGKIFDDACKQKGFSIFHCNIRSLGKNKSLLHDILSTVKTTPDIIAISESKINENTSANLNIPGYAIVNTNSKCRQEVLVCIYRITWNFQEGVT